MLVGVMRHKEIMMALQTRQIGLTTTTVSGVEGGEANIKTLKGIIYYYLLCPRKKEGFFKHIFLGVGSIERFN